MNKGSSSHDLLVVTLGGTIESFYSPVFHGEGKPDGTPMDVPLTARAADTVVPAALRKLGFAGQFDHLALGMRDSKYNTVPQLDALLMAVAEGGYKKIVVVQGTDTMPVQARYVARQLAEWDMADRTVIFTGAMGPLRDARKQWRDETLDTYKNDGWHNLRAAMQDVRTSAPGVYLRIAPGEQPIPAGCIEKYVEYGAPDAKGVREVVRSGFVQVEPDRHQDIRF